MKKTILFWLMFILAIALAVYFAVRIIITINSPRADLDTLALQLSSRPDLRVSSVRQLPNGKYATRAEKHIAIAYWVHADAYYPLTADGTAVNTPIAVRPENSLVFRGKLPADITDIVRMAKPLSSNIDHIAWIENRRWNIITPTGMTVMLPEEDVTAAFDTLHGLQNKNQILSKNIKTLDLRDNSRILVK